MQLVVNDGKVDSEMVEATLTAKVGANTAPTAVAKVANDRVMVNTPVELDGSGSKDPQNDPMTYEWSWLDRPDGSRAEIVNATSEKASFTPDVPGQYMVRLKVKDDSGLENRTDTFDRSVTVFAKARNSPPFLAIRDLPGNQEQIVGNRLMVDPSRLGFGGQLVVYDPDLDKPLHALLVVSEAPEGSVLQNSVFETSNISPGIPIDLQLWSAIDKPGRYVINASVSDAIDTVTTEIIHTAVECEAYPTLMLSDVTSLYRDGSITAAQRCQSIRYFPYAFDHMRVYRDDEIPSYASNVYRYVGQVRTYQLTAYDRDYTITDLKATSTNPALQPLFRGLSEGMVIPKGQTVTFSIVRPALPNEEETSAEIDRLYEEWAPGRYPPGDASAEPKYRALAKQAIDQMDALDFVWSFRIAEEEGYTFRVGR